MSDNIETASSDASVAVTLGGQTHYLEPTPNAIRAISRQFDGLLNAMSAIRRADFNALEFVIAAGLGKIEPKDRLAIGDMVYAEGLEQLAQPALDYIEVLGFGGRRPEELNGAGDDAEGEATGV